MTARTCLVVSLSPCVQPRTQACDIQLTVDFWVELSERAKSWMGQQEGGDKTRMVGMTDGVEPRCKVKLSWSTQNSDETGSSHPLYRRMVVPCLCDSATLSVSWWCTFRVRMATGFMYACTSTGELCG